MPSRNRDLTRQIGVGPLRRSTDDTGLGYNGSALLIGAVLAALALLYFFTAPWRGLLFWAAFSRTPPLGATVANSLDKPVAAGGLAISDLTASAAFAALILVCLLLIPQRVGRHVDAR